MKVLLVDDNTLLLTISALLAEDSGFKVVTAQSGMEACAILETEACFDAIITDMQMPNGNGLSILTYLKTRSLTIPTLLHSADDFYCLDGEILELAYAVEPFSFAVYSSKAAPNHIERFLISLCTGLNQAAE